MKLMRRNPVMLWRVRWPAGLTRYLGRADAHGCSWFIDHEHHQARRPYGYAYAIYAPSPKGAIFLAGTATLRDAIVKYMELGGRP